MGKDESLSLSLKRSRMWYWSVEIDEVIKGRLNR